MRAFSSRAVLGAALALGLSAGAASAQTYNLSLCAASVGGTWQLLGSGLDAAVRKKFPGSTITILTSGGGIANAKSLVEKKCDLAIMHAPEVELALTGGEPFTAPIPNLRVIARLENWSPMHLLVTKDFADKYGIKTASDLGRVKPPIRIIINKRGNISSSLAEALLKESGLSIADIEKAGGKVLRGASAEQTNLMRDGRADGGMNVLYPRHSSILDTAEGVPVTLVGFSPEVVAKVGAEWKVDKFVIPGGTYPFQSSDVETVTLGGHLVALAGTDDKTVSDILAAVTENIDVFHALHHEMKRLTPALLPSATGLPYHPAAVKFYADHHIQPATN
ncbi:TAXI family TRAP transporter solute-binding subunit [Aquabacter sp. CN5-332]|uniref:TAXI family TRAP transporter solute-binding subunit n=1 Tax=Aquabacter sp. CN5-332 TaxID=3156608 RepID=UPI0032B38D9B